MRLAKIWERLAETVAEQVATGRAPVGHAAPCVVRTTVYPNPTPAPLVPRHAGRVFTVPRPASMLLDFRHARDITDLDFLTAVHRAGQPAAYWEVAAALAGTSAERGAAALPGVPYRVVLAKARRLIARGLLMGCHCGCRGDFMVTAAGSAALSEG